MAERHELIEHLAPRHALSVLDHWIWDDFRLVEALHDRAHGPPADLDPDRRRAKMLDALERDVEMGRLVFHRERLEDGAPGTEPVRPARPERPPATPWRPTSTWIEVALVEGDAPVPREAALIVDPAGHRHEVQTNEDGVARVDGIERGVCDVSFPRIDGREWARSPDGLVFAAHTLLNVGHPLAPSGTSGNPFVGDGLIQEKGLVLRPRFGGR